MVKSPRFRITKRVSRYVLGMGSYVPCYTVEEKGFLGMWWNAASMSDGSMGSGRQVFMTEDEAHKWIGHEIERREKLAEVKATKLGVVWESDGTGIAPSDDYSKRRVDSFDLQLPWGWILAVIVAVCLVLDRIGAWVVK